MLSRFRRTDDGSVAVLAAITFPVVLLTVSLAFAAYVWTSSEHEQQRAADTAAVRAAATAFLGTDFPYEDVPGVTGPVTYPNVQAIAALAGKPAPHNLDQCGTVGLMPGLNPVPAGLTLPAGCAGVGPFTPPPALGVADQSWGVACDTARAAMGEDAPYATKFYAGSDDPQPSCHTDASTGKPRIDVSLATHNPLIGFGQHAVDTGTGALDTQVAPQLATVRQALAAFGVHLDSSLPSMICPEISVEVDQPVREPVFDRATVPNGRATARRVVKNAVVVPVYQGATISPVPSEDVGAIAGNGVDVPGSSGMPLHIPPQNLNGLLISAQKQLLTLLDEVDAITDAAVRAANVSIDRLNGVYSGIDPTVSQPPPLPATGPLQSLSATKCLRDTLTQIYDPPTGTAPTADAVLANAAADGEAVIAIQVGAVRAACTEPGAIPLSPDTPAPSAGPQCIRAATTPRLDPATGLYEVPFFDATPVLVQDVGNHNYEAVPVHASQASGAFRASLVRSTDDERFDPKLSETPAPPICKQPVLPSPSPLTACGILSISPTPPSLTPLPTTLPPTVPPVPTTPPPVLPTSSSPTPTPTPTPTKTPTPTPTCLILCGHL